MQHQAVIKPIVAGPRSMVPAQRLCEALMMKRTKIGISSLFKQLVWLCGRVGDNRTNRLMQPMEDHTMAAMDPTNAHRAVFKCRCGMLRAFDAADTVHIALDGSTVGKTPFVISVLALPSGDGGVGSPLVHGGGSANFVLYAIGLRSTG